MLGFIHVYKIFNFLYRITFFFFCFERKHSFSIFYAFLISNHISTCRYLKKQIHWLRPGFHTRSNRIEIDVTDRCIVSGPSDGSGYTPYVRVRRGPRNTDDETMSLARTENITLFTDSRRTCVRLVSAVVLCSWPG